MRLLAAVVTGMVAISQLGGLAAFDANAQTGSGVGAPRWWDGDCDANHWNPLAAAAGWQGAGSHRLGASYLGVAVCGPRPSIDGSPNVTWSKSGWGEYEWQCVELTMRFMAQVYGVSAYSANGNDVVRNYSQSYGGGLVKVDNGTPGKPPLPGDVISFDRAGALGHAGVVSATTIDANGNGTITMLSQNDSADGLRTLGVSVWQVQSFGGNAPYGWLHDPAGRGGGGASSASQPNQQYVQAAYRAFIGRDPSDAERVNWAAQLDDGTSRATLTNTLASSQEWVTVQLRDLYEKVLGREPDSGGAAYWTSRVQSGMRITDIGTFFYGSPEYYQRVGGANSLYVTSLYQNILHRSPDQSGLDHWVGMLDGGTPPATVAADFYASIESRLDRVGDLYRELLGRAPDASGQAYWADQLARLDDIVLAAILGSSDEFFANAQD